MGSEWTEGRSQLLPAAGAVAPEWIQAKDAKVQGRHLEYCDWWNVFQDPTLDALIQTAYNQNLNLRVAGARWKPGRSRRSPWATSSPRRSRRRANIAASP